MQRKKTLIQVTIIGEATQWSSERTLYLSFNILRLQDVLLNYH